MKIIPKSMTQSFGRHILTMKKNSPDTMFVVGLASVLGGTVLACRATLKAKPVIESMQHGVENVKEINKSRENHPSYSEKDYGKDLVYVYMMSTYDLVKLYGPALILTGAGVTLLTSSHRSLKERNASLTAAYAVVTEAFESYRKRVREEVGEDKELDLYIGRSTISIENEDGEKEEAYVVGSTGLSPYARFFDEASSNFQKQPEMNKLFIQCQQNYANDLLYSRGHVFLNEVYDMLGLERSSAGAVVGWILDGDGDNTIDFGIYDVRNEHFLKSWEPRVLLDFNVDGIVYDKIEDNKPEVW